MPIESALLCARVGLQAYPPRFITLRAFGCACWFAQSKRECVHDPKKCVAAWLQKGPRSAVRGTSVCMIAYICLYVL